MELMVVLTDPVFLKVIVCASLVVPVTVFGKAIEVGLKVTESAETPVPVSVAVCGDPDALSATERLAVSVPVATGLNSTETVQVAAAANVEPQVVADLRNDEALVPVMVSEVRFTVPVPVFFIVTVCAAEVDPSAVEAKVRVVGESETVNVAAAPVPESATFCGDPVALSATERLAVNVPVAAGLNSTESVQLAAAARVVPQVFAEIRKDVGLVPVRVSEVRVTVPVLVFFTVTVCAAVVDPSAVEAKDSVVGETVTMSVEDVPVPVNATVCGEPVTLSATERLAVSGPAAAGLNSMETVQLEPPTREVPQVLAEIR